MMEPAYILFDTARGEFAFGCATGSFAGGGEHDDVEFDWDGNDEMDEALAMGGPNFRPMDRSTARSASTAETTSPSSPAAGRLLQQPARRG